MNFVRAAAGGAKPKNRAEASQQRRDVVLLGLLPEQFLQLGELLGVLGRQVVGLGEVLVDVVKLPLVLVGVPAAAGRELRESGGVDPPRNPVQAGAGDPAVLVHGAVAEDLEVLLGVAALGRWRRRRCTAKLAPCMGICSMPSTSFGAGMPATSRMVGTTSMQWVNCVRSPPLSLMRLGQRDDHRVASAAEVRGDLLAPLKRRVARPRPGAGEVRLIVRPAPGVDAAVRVDQLELLLGRQSGCRLCMVNSLKVPVSVPSMLEPLSPQM